MAFGERIRVVIDVAADKAVSSLRSFRTELNNADTAVGKMKVAGGAAFESIKQNAAAMAVAAGAALVGFAAKAVGSFQATALAAGRFSDATGIAVQDASRWIEVAGDLGVSTESIQGAFQRMNKAIADGKLDEFGDAIVRTKSGAVDANATFVKLATTIGAIKDPTERAQAAQAAFGKSYGQIAELMTMSATDLSSALAEVSEAKVIDQGELRNAREFRDAMDELQDKVGDAAMKLGETLVPILLDVADAVETVISPFEQLGQAIGDLPGEGDWFTKEDAERLRDHAGLVDENAAAYVRFAAEMAGGTGGVVEFDASLVDMGDSAADTKRKIEQLQAGVERLQGALSKRDAFEAAVQGWNAVLWASTAATNAEKAGSADAAELRAEANDRVRESINATLDYIATVGGIPSSQTTEIEALIDSGRYNEVESMLQQLARRRTATIEAIGTYLGRERRAAGGPVSAGRSYLVGEKGPELVTMGGNGFVTPNHALGRGTSAVSGGGMNITINMPAGSNGEDVVRAIRRYERVNGAGWRG